MSRKYRKRAGRLNENTIKKLLNGYLSNRGEFYYPEFRLTTGRKIDFISFNWGDGYEIEIRGYECKGLLSAKATAKILREQVADYQRVVPKMYLVMASKEDEKEKISTLCSLNGVGFMHPRYPMYSDLKESEPPKERQLSLDDNHYKPLRAIAAMFLSFREVFEDVLKEAKPRKGFYWCSTPEENDEVQYNCGYEETAKFVYSSVNLEHSRRVMKKVDLRQLAKELSLLPEEYWVSIGVKYFPAPRKPIYSTLIEMNVQSLTLDDLKYLKKVSCDKVAWFMVGKNLWSYKEVLPRRVHVDMIREARDELSTVHRLMETRA